jgi:tetratricopeptide (TPR) repeat protein
VERRYIGAEGGSFDLGFVQRCLLAGRVIAFYLGKLLWPVNLVFVYPRWQVDAGAGWQYLFPLGVAGLLAVLWAVRRRTRGPLAGTVIFIGTLFPALGFINVYPFTFSYVADHFQYLASLGIIAVICGAAEQRFRRWSATSSLRRRDSDGRLPRPEPRSAAEAGGASSTALSWQAGRAGLGRRVRLLQIAVLALVGGLAILTFSQSRVYADADTLYRATLEQNPGAWLAHLNLGNNLWAAGREDEAIGHYREALRLNPAYADIHFDLGRALMETGKAPEAARQFLETVRLSPGDAQAWNNLGIELFTMGRVSEAVPPFKESLRLNPENPKAHNNLGIALRALGREAEAEEEFGLAARLGGGR